MNFNDSVQLYLTAGICCLHGKLEICTEVSFTSSGAMLTLDDEITLQWSEILTRSKISNQFEFTSCLT